jgi:hypothetical protein
MRAGGAAYLGAQAVETVGRVRGNRTEGAMMASTITTIPTKTLVERKPRGGYRFTVEMERMNAWFFDLTDDEFEKFYSQMSRVYREVPTVSDWIATAEPSSKQAQTNTSQPDKLYIRTSGTPGLNTLSFVPSPDADKIPFSASAPQTEPVLVVKQGKEEKKMSTQSDIIRKNLDCSNDELVRLVQIAFPEAKKNSIVSTRYQMLAKQKKGGRETKQAPTPQSTQVPPTSVVEEKTAEPEAVVSAAAMLTEAWKLIDQARALVETMQARLKRLAPFEKAMMDMLCDEHDK